MKSCGGIVPKAGIVIAEVTQRETIQVPLMSWIAKRTEISVVRGHDLHSTAPMQKAVELLHGPDNIANMLDNVHGAHLGETVIREWKRKLVKVCNDIRLGIWIPI